MFPHISKDGKIWLPFAVETKDGRGCGMHELSPDDPKYAKTKKRLEALEREWSWSLFPEEDELAEIDRFTNADVLDAWKLSPPEITQAELGAFCRRLFHPRRLKTQEITGILHRLAMSTSERRAEPSVPQGEFV